MRVAPIPQTTCSTGIGKTTSRYNSAIRKARARTSTATGTKGKPNLTRWALPSHWFPLDTNP